jgi:hypothetical protein
MKLWVCFAIMIFANRNMSMDKKVQQCGSKVFMRIDGYEN